MHCGPPTMALTYVPYLETAVAKIPDKAEQQRRFMALEITDRRRIIRAVNRGQVVDDRKLAVIAVGVARRQQRFWKWAWVLGPVIGMVQSFFPDVSIEAAAVNSLVATGLLLLLCIWWFTRAKRAESLNLEKAGARRSEGSARPQSSDTEVSGGAVERLRGHLPGKGKRNTQADAAPVDDAATDESDDEPIRPPGHRPYKPRGQKRK